MLTDYQSICHCTTVIFLLVCAPEGGGGGGGGVTLIFSHIRRLRLFFGVQNSEFQYFFGFQKNEYLFWV